MKELKKQLLKENNIPEELVLKMYPDLVSDREVAYFSNPPWVACCLNGRKGCTLDRTDVDSKSDLVNDKYRPGIGRDAEIGKELYKLSGKDPEGQFFYMSPVENQSVWPK